MNHHYLFPYKWKNASQIVFILLVLLFTADLIWNIDYSISFLDMNLPVITSKPLFSDRSYFTLQSTNLTYPLLLMLLIISGLVYGFSKEKNEDEMIADIRKVSLVWAVYTNYTVLILSLFLLADFDMIGLIVINVFTLLIFFIARFEWKKHQLKSVGDEE